MPAFVFNDTSTSNVLPDGPVGFRTYLFPKNLIKKKKLALEQNELTHQNLICLQNGVLCKCRFIVQILIGMVCTPIADVESQI